MVTYCTNTTWRVHVVYEYQISSHNMYEYHMGWYLLYENYMGWSRIVHKYLWDGYSCTNTTWFGHASYEHQHGVVNYCRNTTRGDHVLYVYFTG